MILDNALNYLNNFQSRWRPSLSYINDWLFWWREDTYISFEPERRTHLQLALIRAFRVFISLLNFCYCRGFKEYCYGKNIGAIDMSHTNDYHVCERCHVTDDHKDLTRTFVLFPYELRVRSQLAYYSRRFYDIHGYGYWLKAVVDKKTTEYHETLPSTIQTPVSPINYSNYTNRVARLRIGWRMRVFMEDKRLWKMLTVYFWKLLSKK